MVEHLKISEKTDPKRLGILTDTVLPYVNNNLENMNVSIQNMKVVFENITTDIKDNNLEIIERAKI